MTTIKSENWDGVTAPAIPAGWTVDSAPVTATTNSPTSAPNSLIHPAASANASNVPHATWATVDTHGGNVQVSATVRFANSGGGAGEQNIWLFARSSAVAANANWGSASYYLAQISRNSSPNGLLLAKRVSGVSTTLGSAGATAFADATNYRLLLSCVGSTIQASCQRLSDSFWLNSSGTFVSDPTGQTVALSITDMAIAASTGYSGIGFYLGNTLGGAVGVDDWLLVTADPPVPPPPPPVVNPSPQPPTDLTQLLLSVVGYGADADITQPIITDYQSPDAETLVSFDTFSGTGKTMPFSYDDSGYSLWGFAQYG